MNSNDYVSVASDLSVIMSKFEVTRPYNFHKVLKTSVTKFFSLQNRYCSSGSDNLLNPRAFVCDNRFLRKKTNYWCQTKYWCQSKTKLLLSSPVK